MPSVDGPKSWEFGWYSDPDHPGEERYWNGSEWTQRRQASERPNASEEPVRPRRPKSWLLTALVVGVAVLGVVGAVVFIAQSESPIEEDDEAEFREVSITACEPPGALTAQLVRGVAANASSKRSDYHIEVAVLSSDGTRIGTGSTDVRDVEPGQRAVWTSDTDTAGRDWDEGAMCQVTIVERTASH